MDFTQKKQPTDMDIIKLSNRLLMVESMVTDGNIVADIGTDHGYLPIHLVQTGKCSRVIAMDVNKGPLEKARTNIAKYGLLSNIDLRLSNGLQNLNLGEANTITIAGMGGKLISRILEEGITKIDKNTELILSPQSEIDIFRKNLYMSGFDIVMENMLEEDGKYYVIFKCKYVKLDEMGHTETININTDEVGIKYGTYLLEHKNDVLKQYLLKEKHKNKAVLDQIEKTEFDNKEVRIQELNRELSLIEEGLKYYEM